MDARKKWRGNERDFESAKVNRRDLHDREREGLGVRKKKGCADGGGKEEKEER